jgi:hypothetical protein
MRLASPLLFPALAALSCGGGGTPAPVMPAPPSATSAPLAGARCADGVCTCRAPGDDKEDPPPAEGVKRFELRVGSGPGTVWLTINNSQTLLKTREQAQQCFYVDLAPGKHEIVLYGKADKEAEGVGATLAIHEYSPTGPWWYDTFDFVCGVPGPCDPDSLRSWKREVDGYPRSLRDPCGSTKLRGAQWHTGRLPDGAHPDEFIATVTLDVYDFAPKAGPGQCRKAKE